MCRFKVCVVTTRKCIQQLGFKASKESFNAPNRLRFQSKRASRAQTEQADNHGATGRMKLEAMVNRTGPPQS